MHATRCQSSWTPHVPFKQVAIAGDEGELRAIVTDHASSSALDGTGPGNCGTRVMQPWPNNLADLEQVTLFI